MIDFWGLGKKQAVICIIARNFSNWKILVSHPKEIVQLMKSKPIILPLNKDEDEGETKERGQYNEYCYVQYLFAIHSITGQT